MDRDTKRPARGPGPLPGSAGRAPPASPGFDESDEEVRLHVEGPEGADSLGRESAQEEQLRQYEEETERQSSEAEPTRIGGKSR